MGRDVPAMVVSQQDRRAYREKVRQCLDVFARMLRESRFDPQPHHVGLEMEMNLVDDDCLPSMTSTKVLAAISDPSWATELGRFNLEINVPPHQLTGDALGDLEASVLQPARARRRPRAQHRLPDGDDRHPADRAAAGRHGRGHVRQPALPAAQRSDDRRPRRGHADLHRRNGAAAHARRHDHAGGRLHERAVSPAGEPRGVRAATGTPRRRSRASRSRWRRTRRSCSVASCGGRPGSRCSSRSPTPGRRS